MLDQAKINRLEPGWEFEDFVADVLFRDLHIPIVGFRSATYQGKRGENIQGVEIKLDRRLRETGNLYLEVAECWEPGQQMHPAGIRSQCQWYVVGDELAFWLFSVKHLRQWASRWAPREIGGGVDAQTSRGVLMPLEQADRVCAWKWEAPRKRTP